MMTIIFNNTRLCSLRSHHNLLQHHIYHSDNLELLESIWSNDGEVGGFEPAFYVGVKADFIPCGFTFNVGFFCHDIKYGALTELIARRFGIRGGFDQQFCLVCHEDSFIMGIIVWCTHECKYHWQGTNKEQENSTKETRFTQSYVAAEKIDRYLS